MKSILILILLGLSILFSTQQADAHFLATDSNIGAVLHVDPNDEPIAESQASFFFEFKDKENKFTPQKCDCAFSIVENGKVLFSQPLFENNANPSLRNASVFYTFPKRDVYEIKVIGKPLTKKAFQQFTLKWEFRVDQVASEQNISTSNGHSFFSTHLIHIMSIGILLFLFLIYVIRNMISKKTSTKGGEKKHEEKDFSNMY